MYSLFPLSLTFRKGLEFWLKISTPMEFLCYG